MSKRERPYVSRLSEPLKERLAAAQQAKLFVLQSPGPTLFVLREEDSRKKYRVSIGSVHSCTCGAREQPCVHVAFVLLRIFRIQSNDNRCWQASLIDRELEELVESRARSVARAALARRDWGSAPMCEPCEPGADPANVPRRPLDFAEDADPCPICYEDIGPADDAAGLLDWCRKSCGKSLHKRCFATWAEHQQSIGQKLTCPHCRGEWSEEQQQVHGRGGCCSSLGGTGTAHTGGGASGGAGGGSSGTVAGAAAAAAARRAVHKDARCKSCRVMGIAGARYRCLVCPQGTVELCGECFDSCMHPHHPFAVVREQRSSRPTAGARRSAS